MEALGKIGEKNSTNDHSVRDFTVMSSGYDTVKSGNTGYIRSDMLKQSSSSGSTASSDQTSDSTPTSGRVVDGWLNVRSGAGTSNKVLVVISEGTKVTISESVKDGSGSLWYHITVNYGGVNYDGYVSSQYISK